eukprot:Transcript_27873.p1 GENE.Transcript_27873~~Transcript_27873.p1  ORF type:complete len:317 (+),score=37.70 Transcript_27873:72-953(+)
MSSGGKPSESSPLIPEGAPAAPLENLSSAELRSRLEQSLKENNFLRAENIELGARLKQVKLEVGDDDGAGSTTSLESQMSQSMPMDTYLRVPYWQHLRIRTPWLAFLLLLQSFSAFVLGAFDEIFERHIVVTLFITMIVGAGGNAGNQPGVMMTRALSKEREYIRANLRAVLRIEFVLAIIQGVILGSLAFTRVLVEYPTQWRSALVVGGAVGSIVFIGVFLGIGFALGIDKLQLDPAAGAAPLTSVLADTLGITVICLLALAILGWEATGVPKYCPKAHVCPEEYFPCKNFG